MPFDAGETVHGHTIAAQPEHGQPAVAQLGRALVEDEVAQAVDDGPAAVPLHRLPHVRMVSEYNVGAGVDGEMSQFLLA